MAHLVIVTTEFHFIECTTCAGWSYLGDVHTLPIDEV